jgi:hypothetical protein
VNETIDSLGNQIDALSIEKKQLEVFEIAEWENTLLIWTFYLCKYNSLDAILFVISSSLKPEIKTILLK